MKKTPHSDTRAVATTSKKRAVPRVGYTADYTQTNASFPWGASRKRTRGSTSKRRHVQFARGTVFIERIGAYVSPVAIRHFADINDDSKCEDGCDDGCCEKCASDNDWLVSAAGTGAIIL